ncbi:hypothetical protein PybrP1_009630 [[Pythium] brassicae (nom. inval.)]|nr:hypothetical protein PybrP1_009630 [[Pythium] brassicae (nom. inval.)]
MREPDTTHGVDVAGGDFGSDLLDMLKTFLLVLNALLLVAGLIVAARASGPKRVEDTNADTSAGTKRALLVTAHPDDESMFFLPLVHSLAVATPREWELHLLCLSRGDFDGLGAVRERELHTCGAFLGLVPENVRVVEDPALQDGMRTQWPHARVAEIVLAYVEQYEISAVFTFDDYGVSGHPNHMATHHGVQLAYIGVADAVVSTWTLGADGAFVFLFQPWWNYAAMALHRSQFVWYRRLFVAFSRYTYVNTFVPLGPAVSAPPPVGPAASKKSQ